MRKTTWILLLAVIAGAAGWWLYRPGMVGGGANHAPASVAALPIPVTTAIAARQDVPVYFQGLGTVQASNSVLIHTQVDGQLRQISFKEGQEVHTGDVLAQIDPRTYQAVLDQALAKRAQDQAQLANARNDMHRYAGLVERQFVARQQLDTAQAQVAQLEALVQGDEALIENARVQLGYTTIRSPIDGRAGFRIIDQGNLVRAADPAGIVVISQMRPIAVLFSLPDSSLSKIVKAMAAGPLKVTAFSRDGKDRLGEGQLDLVDNQIDQTTGSVRLKATMPNEDGILWPGQFVNARLMVETLRQVVTIPATAILRGQEGAYAYVVKADRTVEARPLTVGVVADGMAVIQTGVGEGEVVVATGHYRLQPGSRIEVRAAAVSDATAAHRVE